LIFSFTQSYAEPGNTTVELTSLPPSSNFLIQDPDGIGFISITSSDGSGGTLVPGCLFPTIAVSFSKPTSDTPLKLIVIDCQVDQDETEWLVLPTIVICLEGSCLPPTIISEDFNDNLEVGPEDNVIVIGVAINGNISINGGKLSIQNGATVNGNINGEGGSSILIEDSPNINGNIESKDGGILIMTNSQMNGNIRSENDNFVRINGNTINGNVDVTGAADSDTSGNTIK